MRRTDCLAVAPLVAMVVLASAALPCMAEGPPLVRVGKASVAPQIDGKLDDACWDTAAIIGPFLLNDGSGPATQQTRGRLCWDDRALYLAFECLERALEPQTQQLHLLKRTVTAHDGSVFGDESLEIFLRPGGRGDYYQLASNMLGTRYESRGMDASFDGEWLTGTTVVRDAWRLEAAVPFASLGASAPAPGDKWTFNVCRNENPRGEHSTWSGLAGAFHSPDQFGVLVFGEATIGVGLADLADLGAGAAGLKLQLGPAAPPLKAIMELKERGGRQVAAEVPAGSRELTLTYPPTRGQTPPSIQYHVTLKDGTIVCRSPLFSRTGMLLELTGDIAMSGGKGAILCNGRLVAALEPGRKIGIRTRLSPGENVLAITAPGSQALAGTLSCGGQTFSMARGWRWSDTADDGWDEPGFDAEKWRPVTDAAADEISLPEAETVYLRRVIAVSDKRERFWPLQADLNLPRDSRMFIKPILGWVGAPPADYVYCLDLPAPLRIDAHDNLDGVQLKPITSEPLQRDGRDYTRYALQPVGTLVGGFTLELLWKNKANTSHQYVSALSFGGTFDWRDSSVEVTSPPYAELVGVLCLKWQNRGIHGTCWFDDISLTEKDNDVNLLPQGNFETDEWTGKPNVADYRRNGKPDRACRLSGTEEQVSQQTGLWVSIPTIEVKPNTRYVLRVRAKGEKIVSKGGAGRACLVADVGSPAADQLTVYSHYEALDGHIVEAERASTLNILPALKDRAPRRVPVIVAYGSAAYENPRVWDANAAMVRGAGINWLWGSNHSALAEALKPDGVKYVWHIPRNGFSQDPVDREYLKRHPDHAALQKNGAKSNSQICPTILLDTENEFIPELREWLVQRIKENPYDMIDWDHEFPVNYPNSVCLCERCRKAFADWAKLADMPTPEDIWEKHERQWIAFRCNLNVRMARVIRDACKAADPDIPFSVYSGYQTDRTQSLYGVDWSIMRPVIDWGIAGYNGGRGTIRKTMQALGDVPFTSGCMYVEKRFEAERPYPTPPQWRLRLLRAMLDDEGNGLLVWCLPVLDGGGYWGIGWVSALVADFEDFFIDFNRQDNLVDCEPALDESSCQSARYCAVWGR